MPDIEGEMVMGWPDRKRLSNQLTTDRQGRVIDGRSPFTDLEGLITPSDLRYVKIQLEMPEPIHPDDLRLSIEGQVNQPFELTLSELQKLPARTVRLVTECSGSDAHFFEWERSGGQEHSCDVHPSEEGKPSRHDLTQPHMGQVSSGEFTGVSLSLVLEKAGLNASAVGVRAEGFDRGRPSEQAAQGAAGGPEEINYDKCLPLEKALDPDTIVAWALNGEYLRHVHGAPMRLVVPGWSGNWSVKWLQRLEVLDHIAPCFYQTEYFFYADSLEAEDRTMVTAMGVKSIITDPRDDDPPQARGERVVRGLAWSGYGAITRVEVSVDGGDSWHDAHLEEPRERWLWARWSYRWNAQEPGDYKIMSRATDEAARQQPQIEWNVLRKNFDGIVPVDVTVT